jgi:hypothetical protein
MSSGPYTQTQVLLIKASEDEAALRRLGILTQCLGFTPNRRSKSR